MPNTRNFPFRRLAVDHLVLGGTRVWWQLEPTFRPLEVCFFQLQWSHSGIPAAGDWLNVGLPAANTYHAVDDQQRLYGKTLDAFYRVALTVGTQTFLSETAHIGGGLTDHDWLMSHEILRKESLRAREFSHCEGFLLKLMRYGAPCPRCRDPLTDEVTDSTCPICGGSGFRNGYHPAVPLCVEKSNETVVEGVDPQSRGSIDDQTITGRVIAFPMVQKYDIWVESHTDKRWSVNKVAQIVTRRTIPLISQLTLNLLPFSDASYQLSTCPGEIDTSLPGTGDGCVTVDHNYTGTDSLTYLSAAGMPVNGATILAFTKAVYDANDAQPPITLAIAATRTNSGGRWVSALHLNPGHYVLVVGKAGEFGPDACEIVVEQPSGSSSSTSSAYFEL